MMAPPKGGELLGLNVTVAPRAALARDIAIPIIARLMCDFLSLFMVNNSEPSYALRGRFECAAVQEQDRLSPESWEECCFHADTLFSDEPGRTGSTRDCLSIGERHPLSIEKTKGLRKSRIQTSLLSLRFHLGCYTNAKCKQADGGTLSFGMSGSGIMSEVNDLMELLRTVVADGDFGVTFRTRARQPRVPADRFFEPRP